MTALAQTTWRVKPWPTEPDHKSLARLAERLEVSPLLVRLMALRGLNSEQAMDQFLSPGLRYFSPLEHWPGFEAGAAFLRTAIQNGKKIAVWGDYDVDGITATALIKDFLALHGVEALHHIPSRLDFGYGLHLQGIQELAEQGAGVLLTVDCGISNVAEIQKARELGLDTVITDHHLPGPELPTADIIINPKLQEWPSQELAGVGVAFLLMAALNRLLPGPAVDMREYLDLVALGTIADVVPLDEHNRILVKNGMLFMAEAKRPGLRALKEASGIEGTGHVGTSAIGFALAPRINAAGRIGDPDLAVRLLLEKNPDAARALAQKLDDLNTERRAEEQPILEEAIAQAEEQRHLPGLVLYSEHWHSGIIGIVASRIVERFHRPCLILTKENGFFKGSGRATPDFDLHKALQACASCLSQFGGHRQAAGFKLEPFQLATLRQLFTQAALDQLGTNPPQPALEVDAELPFADLSATLLKELELLQPYGQGNPRPIFLSPPLSVLRHRLFGQKRHLELHVSDRTDGTTMRAVAWRQGEHWRQPGSKPIRLAYTPRLSNFNGLRQIELTVTHIFTPAEEIA